ncbi:MAG: hemolysin family protein [Pseudomonadota bacterium]
MATANQKPRNGLDQGTATPAPGGDGLLARIKRLFGSDDGADINNNAAIYGEMASNGRNGAKNGNGRHGSEADNAAAAHERMLIQNVLALRDLSAADCMVPRVDINAIEVDTPQSDLMRLLANKTHSRMPVYRESLDEVVGVLHVRDVLAALAAGKPLVLPELVRNPMIVAPSMPVMDLLLEMRMKQTHLALVVDEFGGIDGLVTIEDLVEQSDGTLIVDARLDIDDFEAHLGNLLTEEEREDIDTLGGLVFALAGEVPNRGALIPHDSGLEFEVLECDPRRIRRLRVHHHRTASRHDGDQNTASASASSQS